MKFIVTQTSSYSKSKEYPICKNAKLEVFQELYESGATKEVEYWTIELKTLEELEKFIDENGERIVLQRSGFGDLHIEIYNQYRE
jgi:hypothetical protein